MADRIATTGLLELRAELRAIEPAWPKELRKVNLAISEAVAAGTRDAFASMAGSAPLVAPTVKALAQQVKAQVKVGGSGNSVGEQVAMGNLWGSSRFKQFPPTRAGGYALYPTFMNLRPDIEDRYLQMLDELLARAFPN